ncbi:hypothetical protein CH249_01450 [Rhodococcus sp. 05-2255-3B1]|nr:hypothetical protein CH250_05915 [Rhodococcus sp. 05-2255-3C]OZE15949.1 hypothetical protein CH249_01450 [Rhodococcus sp. 05-2255-3B1]OZE18988.1 hypothetical protein CH255_13475 [Rhodococcus sp. 05-2255-2A2]
MSRINVLLGKNGSGKSTVLKRIDAGVPAATSDWTQSKYITPERGGTLSYEPTVDTNMAQIPTWIDDTRRANRFNQFREQTVAQYRQLELGVLRTVEQQTKMGLKVDLFFSDYLGQINGLLDNIEIKSTGTDVAFKMYDKTTGSEIPAKDISSGESELISLAIECLVFAQKVSKDGRGLLILDEPDVHLHPDLQSRLMIFLKDLVERFDFDVLLATHSTPILGELAKYTDAAVCLMTARQKSFLFEPIDDMYRQLLPVFGAHPLTRVFSDSPTLLVEGEDDVRIWQQAVRTAQGNLRMYPVECGGVSMMDGYETRLGQVLNSVYDGAVGFSLRDRDDSPEAIVDVWPVKRMRLSCRAAENLLLCDDVLAAVNLSWTEVVQSIGDWIDRYPDHLKSSKVLEFQNGGLDRKGFDLKEIRMILVGQILGSDKPWEVLVGQQIGRLAKSGSRHEGEHSLESYLGQKTMRELLQM